MAKACLRPTGYRIFKSSHPVGIRHALSLNRNNNFSYPYSIGAKIQKFPRFSIFLISNNLHHLTRCHNKINFRKMFDIADYKI